MPATPLRSLVPLIGCRVAACALAAVAVLAFNSRVSEIRDEGAWGGLGRLPPPGRGVNDQPRPGGCNFPDPATVYLTASRLNTQSASLRLDVAVCIGAKLLHSLRTERSAIAYGSLGEPKLRDRYAHRRVTVTFEGKAQSFPSGPDRHH